MHKTNKLFDAKKNHLRNISKQNEKNLVLILKSIMIFIILSKFQTLGEGKQTLHKHIQVNQVFFFLNGN